MVLRACLLFLAFTIAGCGDDDDPGNDDGGMPDSGRRDGDGAMNDAPDGRRDTGMDGNPDAPGSDGTPDGTPPIDGGPDATIDTGPSCVTDRILLARAGTTSACSFELPAGVDHARVNLVLEHRVGFDEPLCYDGFEGCRDGIEWFFIGDEVALCDATCIALEDTYPTGALYAEIGCERTSCMGGGCLPAGEFCDADRSFCCVGTECRGGRCASCTAAGLACMDDAECCDGNCDGGICKAGIDGQCDNDSGCTVGTCISYQCRCPDFHIACGGACVDQRESPNCMGCGNTCRSDQVCTFLGCDCGGASPNSCELGAYCTDTATDAENCGYCHRTCNPDHVCNGGNCVCPPGLMECSGNCVDIATSAGNCGGCGNPCYSPFACQGGMCLCAPGTMMCGSSCYDLQTSNLHCGMCGNDCRGGRTCVGGMCVT